MSIEKTKLVIDWLTSLKNLDETQVISNNTQAILNELDRPSPDISVIKPLVATEPLLSAKLLLICNSPFFGFARHIEDIEETIVLLGFKKLKSLVYTSIVLNTASDKQLKLYIQHSLATAVICRELCHNLSRPGEPGYLAGLLHLLPIIINYRPGIEHLLSIQVLHKASAIVFDRMNFPDPICSTIIGMYDSQNQPEASKILKIAFNMAIVMQGPEHAAFKRISNLESELLTLGIRPHDLADWLWNAEDERQQLIELIR